MTTPEGLQWGFKFVGADRATDDLRGANLRGAYLRGAIGAVLPSGWTLSADGFGVPS